MNLTISVDLLEEVKIVSHRESVSTCSSSYSVSVVASVMVLSVAGQQVSLVQHSVDSIFPEAETSVPLKEHMK